MRSISGNIWDLWNAAGPFLGDNKAQTRVTVESGWSLQTWTTPVGAYSKVPIRYFTKNDHSVSIETEVSNIKSVSIDRSLDQDAATCEITLFNTTLLDDHAQNPIPNQMGVPGWYTFNYGENPEAVSRWNQTTNQWEEMLTPNSLIRTYQGYGGLTNGVQPSIQSALTNGHLAQTGTWLVDEVRVNTDGTLTLKCRDMCKLLIDQVLYPPLVPANLYPVHYQRFYGPFPWQNAPILYGPTVNNVKVITGFDTSPDNLGYWLSGSDGGVFTYGDLNFYGSLDGDVVSPSEIVDIAKAPDGKGYYVLSNTGAVFAWGSALWNGDAGNLTLSAPMVRMAVKPDNSGYWLLGQDGAIYTYGTATYYGRETGRPTHFVDICSTLSGNGYLLFDAGGETYAHGDATFEGTIAPNGLAQPIVAAALTPSGAGYYLVGADGGVFTYGDAHFQGSIPSMATPITLDAPICDIAVMSDNSGYWMCAQDGGVFTFGSAPFVGSLPGDSTNTLFVDGNYKDLTDIVQDLLLWSGFWLHDGGTAANVYGLLEETGTYIKNSILGSLDPSQQLPDDNFDKHPPIDAINELKTIVGYLFWVDETGAANWVSPNFFTPGNILPNGAPTDFIPEIDETKNMTNYQMTFHDEAMRSQVVVSSFEPLIHLAGTVTSTYTPQSSVKYLKGLVRPAMLVSYFLTDQTTQQIMAELIALYIWFQQRLGSVTCAANPWIGINDQVRIFERQSSETYIHYVRGIHTEHDLTTGQYTMTLTSHWLGDANNWAVTAPSSTNFTLPPF